MIANAFFVTTILLLALGFYLLGECRFLIPYRRLLLESYGESIALFAAALFVNVFAAVYLLGRKLFLKDTGRKLAHLEKQLQTGANLSEELSRRVNE
ncbi:MAG TPA: hypothetical protein VGG72_35070 [Bryobacteraceae bacterium]|jgi:hypothetical protein